MARQRRGSNVSNNSSNVEQHQELSSMYDYLAKIILLGPSGCGKSCLLHRIVKNEWRILSSQTVGVEFASRIIKVGTGARRKRIKLQLWDTAGTERFRSVSRSYYRGAAGAVLVYDLASHVSFDGLPTFLSDARALASPNLTVLLAGNKVDLTADANQNGDIFQTPPASATNTPKGHEEDRLSSSHSSTTYGLGARQTATVAPEGREVTQHEAARWASNSAVPVSVEVSAFTGEGVEEVFTRLASMILTKIELGEIDPDDPTSGIQYGDNMGWDDGESVKSRGTLIEDSGTARRRRKGGKSKWTSGMREWESVFKVDPTRTTSVLDLLIPLDKVLVPPLSLYMNRPYSDLEDYHVTLVFAPETTARLLHRMFSFEHPFSVLVIAFKDVIVRQASTMGAKRRYDLKRGWHFRQHDDPKSKYLPTQEFPTEIHRDLLKRGIIVDPFRGKREEDVQWVAEVPWIYRTTFSTPQTVGGERVILAFDGLDTYAQVVLNGRTILQTENMFLPQRVDVTDLVSLLDEENVLEIIFESALLKGKKFVEEQPNHRWGCWNGDPSRLAVRKAQYHYGWDWGPQLMTCGPWRPIYLEVYYSQIVDLAFTVDVSDSLDTAAICASVSVDGEASRVKFEISINDALVGTETVNINNEQAQATFRTYKPKLWYPRSYGQQPLYLLTATLLDDEAVLDIVSKRIGIRKAKLVQHKLDSSPGSSFIFEINNVPIFCGGSNWIPADSFLTRLTPSKYRDWVEMASEGNQRMLRVWGGGIYEDDAFYDACDEMGVLVWQDFMFACGNYPVHSEFLRTVECEAVANVKRLRHHPSIVIFAGNNEDYQYAESEGLYYDPTDKCPESWLRSTFPARYIYEKLLKDVMSDLLPDTYYHFGSPYSETETTDPCRGDLHQWNVWHGSQERYQDFDRLSGRFVSEFGMQALPNWETVQEFFDPEDVDAEKYAQSSTVSFHNKAAGHDRRLGIYLTENIRYNFEPFEYYVYCTQVMQADCVTSAFSAWKRNWKGPGNEQCAGALVWQTNDCWPSTSWAISDYSLRPKLAYYAVKRQMEQVTLGMKRTITRFPTHKYTHAHVKTVYKIELWACNFDLQDHDLPITISTIHLDTGIHHHHEHLSRTHTLAPNRTTELMSFEIPVLQQDVAEEPQTIVCATLEGPSHSTKRDFIDWPQPLKYLHLNGASGQESPRIRLALSLPWESLDEVKSGLCPQNKSLEGVRWLNIKTDFPLKAVNVECKAFDNAKAAALEENGFDVMPGRWRQVRVNGLDASPDARFDFRITHLGSRGKAEFERVEVISSMVLLLKMYRQGDVSGGCVF